MEDSYVADHMNLLGLELAELLHFQDGVWVSYSI